MAALSAALITAWTVVALEPPPVPPSTLFSPPDRTAEHSVAPPIGLRLQPSELRGFLSPFPSSLLSSSSPPLVSSQRGYVAVVYTGLARSFSAVFVSHLLHLICSSPYAVHLFFMLMLSDESSDYLSVPATLHYYDACQTLDGDWLTVADAVKGWKVQRQADVDFDAELSELRRIHRYVNAPNWWPTSPVQYWAFNQAETMRAAYAAEHGVEYQWVFKQRVDAMQPTSVWHSLFTVQHVWDFLVRDAQSMDADAWLHRLSSLRFEPSPLPDYSAAMSASSDGSLPSHLVGELVFTPRASSSDLNIPSCDDWWGINDQFAAANASLMHRYFTRGYAFDELWQMSHEAWARITKEGDDPGHSLNFLWNTESFLMQMLAHWGVEHRPLPHFCYYVIRTDHGKEERAAHAQHVSAQTYCELPWQRYGRQCCLDSCTAITERRRDWAATIDRLSDRGRRKEAVAALQAVIRFSLRSLLLRHPQLRLQSDSDWSRPLLLLHDDIQRWLTTKANTTDSLRSAFPPSFLSSPNLTVADSTPPATVAWLDEVNFLSHDYGSRFSSYAQLATLATAVARAAQATSTAANERAVLTAQPAQSVTESRAVAVEAELDGRLLGDGGSKIDSSGSPLSFLSASSLPLSALFFATYGTESGLQASACHYDDDGEEGGGMASLPYALDEQLNPALRLTSDPLRRSRYHQQRVCSMQPIITRPPVECDSGCKRRKWWRRHAAAVVSSLLFLFVLAFVLTSLARRQRVAHPPSPPASSYR